MVKSYSIIIITLILPKLNLNHTHTVLNNLMKCKFNKIL